MLTKDFWYDLPSDRIAQAPMRPRDHSKLMILNCNKKSLKHSHFFNVSEFLKPSDLLIINDTKVFKARLKAKKFEGGRSFEVFLLRPSHNKNWLALAKPAKKLSIGDILIFGPDFTGKITAKQADGTLNININLTVDQVFKLADKYGQVPTPPYVEQTPTDEKDYQTIYAQKTGSAAAPTAGFHFTDELITKLKSHGINFATITLHVGLGTFRPVKSDNLEDHVMHEEWIDIPQQTCNLIEQTKKNSGKVIAVGTTTVRALEGAARAQNNVLKSFKGFTNIFIKPGDDFFVIDGMITNFHLPQSTLIVLVSAFAQSKIQKNDEGRQFVLKAYKEAIHNDYRFYSFGDAMFIS